MPRSDENLERHRQELARVSGLPVDTQNQRVEFVRAYLLLLNEFMFETAENVEDLNDPIEGHSDWRRVTPFLAIWDDYAEKVLDICFNEQQIDLLARKLVGGLGRSPALNARPVLLAADVPTNHLANLTPRQFAIVRLMHALQDFAEELPSIDEILVRKICDAMPNHMIPDEHDLGAPDAARALLAAFGGADRNVNERVRYIADAAMRLIQHHGGSAYNLASSCNHDVQRTFDALISFGGIKGKKAYMILRDFYEFGIWDLQTGLNNLHVIPDNRLMRLALRTGIICPAPGKLFNSLLDQFDFQYGLTVNATVEGFRRVWDRTRLYHGGTPICPYPARLDAFLFKLGDGVGGCCKPNAPVCRTRRRPPRFHEWLGDTHQWNCPTPCPFEGVCPVEKIGLLAPYAIQNNTWLKIYTGRGGGGGLRGV